MRRIVLVLVAVGALLLAAQPAEAFHGRHRCWGGGWGGGWGWSGGWGGGCGWGGVSLCIQPYNGCFVPAYSCYSPCYGGYGYGGYGGYYGSTYYNPQANFVEYNLPSIYQPAELAYGPQAAKQFLGLNRNFALGNLRQPALPLTVAPLKLPSRPATVTSAKPAVRTSNAETRHRAEQYIALGDELFRQQKYHSAVQKYKLAAETAPDVAEAYWRQGHALAASNRFDLAAGCFKRALAIDGDVSRGGFQLDDLYGSSTAAKQAHIEALAADALERSGEADPYFMLGIFLQYDGQAERAAKFFHQAAALSPEGTAHLTAFVPTTKRAPATVSVSTGPEI